MPPACSGRHDDSCFLAMKIGNANTNKKRGALQNASKKQIGQLQKELADLSFCGRIKLL